MTLIKEGIITSLILVAIGVGGYFLGGAASKTALIPAFAAIPIFISTLIAIKSLKIGMHLAALFALLGFLAPLGRLIPSIIKDGVQLGLPLYSMVAMAVVCAIFLSLCIKSFKRVRASKARELDA